MKRKGLIIFLGIVVLISIVYLGLQANIAQVEVINVSRQSISKVIEETGYVEAVDDFTVSASQSGKIVNLSLHAGDAVKEGDFIMEIENPDINIEYENYSHSSHEIQAQLNAGEITRQDLKLKLDMAALDLERKTKLYQQDAVSKADLENAQLLVSNYEQALTSQEALLEQLRVQLGSTENAQAEAIKKKSQLTVSSPLNGILLDLPVENGDVVNPGDILVQVGKSNQLEIKADLLSDDLSEVEIGQKVSISLPGEGNRQSTGQVKKIYPRAYTKVSALGIEQKRVPVTISLDQPAALKPDYEVRVAIETAASQETLVLPRESVILMPDGDYAVWLVNNDRIETRKVTTGIKNSENIEITDGLTVGDLIVRNAMLDLKDGQKIKALAQK